MSPESSSAIALAALLAFSTLTIGAASSWPASVVQCGLYLLAMTWALAATFGRRRVRRAPWLAILAAPALWGVAQILTSRTVHSRQTIAAVLDWTALFCIFAVGLQVLAEESVRRRFLRLLLCFGVMVALYTMLAPYTGLSAPIPNRNNYASFVLLLLPVAAWQGMNDRRSAWIGWTAAGLLFATVIASGSRAGTLLAMLEIIAVFTTAWLRRVASGRRLAIGALSFVALGAVFTAVAGWQLLVDRVRLYDPLQYRREIYQSTLNMIAERPWTGFGLGTFEKVYPKFALFDVGLIVNYAHNDWLQWAAEGGVPLLFLLAAAMAVVALPAARTVWGLGVVFVALHGLADFPMQRIGVAGWMVAMLAAVAATGRSSSRAPGRARFPREASTRAPLSSPPATRRK